MPSWRERILKDFVPHVARLTLVADPDALLADEDIQQELRNRGFESLLFDDPIGFRYAYESQYRARWDRGERLDAAVIIRVGSGDVTLLPFDLVQAGRQLSFNLGELFPKLSYPVVAALEQTYLDALYPAQPGEHDPSLGDNATKDFVLRQVFEIFPELINQPTALLRMLLRKHYRAQRLPSILDERLLSLLQQSGRFTDWPLADIVPDRESFLTFLQERWPAFIERTLGLGDHRVHDASSSDARTLPGPLDLPFEEADVRAYVDSLFLDGMLQPVSHPGGDRLIGTWAAVGIRSDPQADRRRRLQGLMDSLETIPSHDAPYQEWFLFAPRWAELGALWHADSGDQPAALADRFNQLRQQIDAAFFPWVQHRYAALYNYPPFPPVMLHHIPRMLVRIQEEHKGGRVALIVMDGLAFDQWVVLREVLQGQGQKFVLRERSVFAWVPSITSVSRQATFAGKPPLYFPNSLTTTSREPALWSRFWADNGLRDMEIGYVKGLGTAGWDAVEDAIARPAIRALGLVIDTVDRIMHGMALGSAGMQNQVRQWASQGHLSALLDILLDKGFSIVLTSDHGNLEVEGIGRPAEGAIADYRGERLRVYADRGLRATVKARYPDSIEWDAGGLPENFLPLLAPARGAFTDTGDRVVAHGGISLEELIVPLIQIERSTR